MYKDEQSEGHQSAKFYTGTLNSVGSLFKRDPSVQI